MKTTGAYLDWPYEGDEFDDRATTRPPQSMRVFCINVNHSYTMTDRTGTLLRGEWRKK